MQPPVHDCSHPFGKCILSYPNQERRSEIVPVDTEWMPQFCVRSSGFCPNTERLDIHVTSPRAIALTIPCCFGRVRARRGTHRLLETTYVSPIKFLRPAASLKMLQAWWLAASWHIFSQVKDQLLHFGSLARKKEAQNLLGIFGFLRKHILHLRIARPAWLRGLSDDL